VEERICQLPGPHLMKLTPGCPGEGSLKVTVVDDLHAFLHRSFSRLLALSGLGWDILPSC